MCGAAHAPKFIGEAISQAHAVAARAASVLSRKQMAVGGQTAFVDSDKCISCMTCVHVCPYMAPRINEDNKAEVEIMQRIFADLTARGYKAFSIAKSAGDAGTAGAVTSEPRKSFDPEAKKMLLVPPIQAG